MVQRLMEIASRFPAPRCAGIADEPTTVLDVTTQKVVMDPLGQIAAQRGWRRF